MEQDREITQGEEVIGRLIAAAGPGTTASPAARQRVYDAVQARWERSVSERRAAALKRRATQYRVYGLAATLAVAAATFYLLQGPSTTSPGSAALAAISQARGSVTILRAGERLDAAAAGSLEAGDTLRTGADGQLAIALADGMSLRVNVDSELAFADQAHVNLAAGTIYLDSGLGNRADLEVLTPLGTVEHVGTQYEVNVGESNLRLRVREGSVAYSGVAGELTTAAGQQVDVASNGQTTMMAFAADDPAWDWAEALAVLAPAEDYVVGEVIAWAARELALEIEYANPQIELRWATEKTKYLAEFNPEQALDAIEQTTDTTLTISEGRLLIGN